MAATPDPFAHHPELRDKIEDPAEATFYRNFSVETLFADKPELHWVLDLLHSDETREEIRRAALAQHPGGDLWVFGYGSLMWNPAFHFAEVRRATLPGLCAPVHPQGCLRRARHAGRAGPDGRARRRRVLRGARVPDCGEGHRDRDGDPLAPRMYLAQLPPGFRHAGTRRRPGSGADVSGRSCSGDDPARSDLRGPGPPHRHRHRVSWAPAGIISPASSTISPPSTSIDEDCARLLADVDRLLRRMR